MFPDFSHRKQILPWTGRLHGNKLGIGKQFATLSDNNHMRPATIASICLAGFFSISATAAIFVLPTSYTATPGEGVAQGGSFDYFDESGSQLTDGVFGVDSWNADLGNGPAYEWVGWRVADPVITFNFASSVTLQSVIIGFNRHEGVLIFLPPTVKIGGDTFTLGGSELDNGTRGDLSFNGSWTGNSLQIELADADGSHWIFVDEIRFEAIPEPRVVELAAALGVVGFVLKRRFRLK